MMDAVQLTEEIQKIVCAYIHSGAFPHMAAEAAGVSRELFEVWMRRGAKKGKKSEYHAFAAAVRKAVATARVAAEIRAFQEEPLAWLKSGPGKERAENPGWTTTVKPAKHTHNSVNILLTPDGQRLMMTLLQLLAPYPEARAAVAQALSGGSSLLPAPTQGTGAM